MKRNIDRVFWDKVEKTDSCWIWKACKDTKGYGLINRNGAMIRAHRLSYEMAFGEIPEGLTIDHLCRNRACVNPDHLEVVTNKENVLRGIGLTAQNARKTHCLKGHVLSGVYKDGKRRCKTCHNRRSREYRQKTGSEFGCIHWEERE